MAEQVRQKWPQWPALKIQEWQNLIMDQEVKYRYLTIGKFKGVLISTHKLVPADERHPWPKYPILGVQDHLSLTLDADVTYENLEWYIAVYITGSDMPYDEVKGVLEEGVME